REEPAHDEHAVDESGEDLDPWRDAVPAVRLFELGARFLDTDQRSADDDKGVGEADHERGALEDEEPSDRAPEPATAGNARVAIARGRADPLDDRRTRPSRRRSQALAQRTHQRIARI